MEKKGLFSIRLAHIASVTASVSIVLGLLFGVITYLERQETYHRELQSFYASGGTNGQR